MRRNVTAWLSVLSLVVLVGCGADARQILQEVNAEAEAKRTSPAPAPTVQSGETIRIASFNIQVFGVSKMNKPEVVDILAQVVRRFDIVAIQEVRAADQTVVPRFVDAVNATGRHYAHVLGPRLGRTSSKEQYAYIFDTQRVELTPGSVYTPADRTDLLHREPLVARFQTRVPAGQEGFSCTLINVHTDPDETDQELDALDDVYLSVRNDAPLEDDVILLGDLNVNERKLGQLGQISGITYVVSGVPTNTRGKSTYDNLVFDRASTTEFTGAWGVLDLMGEYSLTLQQALKVSDHLPVWAEFSAHEHVRGIAGRPGEIVR
ncbi:MAG: endonuclease/exonuclease/phosphatase family protein [Pirellulales bacterium]|nr:endonuclease/exonuclease/phosphatase family protein [Pirellulales bacterium]